ncbi:MAG: ATP synthase F1 subunit delta [Candidatus Omnitrophota bacterium]
MAGGAKGITTTDLLAAERYAQALFDVARLLHRDLETQEELEAFSVALKRSPDIEEFFGNPYFKVEVKRRFLEKIYQKRLHEVYGLLLNFFTLLLKKNRFNLIHEITESFKRISDRARGMGVAQIRTAVPLDARSEEVILARLEKIAGYKIRVKKEVDPALIGGVVVKIRNKILDGSVRNRIELFKKELTKIKSI